MKDTISRRAVIDMLMSENQNEPRYPEWYASKVEEIEGVPVLYPCDQDRCGDKCHWPLCRLTTDPEHAVAGGHTILIDNRELEPKRPEGHWNRIKIKGYDYAICSECGLIADMIEENRTDGPSMSMEVYGEMYAKFCPNCGSRMIGGEAQEGGYR